MGKRPKRVFVLAAFAGTIHGVFFGNQMSAGSGIGIGDGAVVGLLILSPAIAMVALGTAGVFMGMGNLGPEWTEDHDRRAQSLATVLLILVISGTLGLLFAPISQIDMNLWPIIQRSEPRASRPARMQATSAIDCCDPIRPISFDPGGET